MTTAAYRLGTFLDNLPLNRRHWLVFAVCSVGFVFDALDFQIMALSAPTIAKEWSIDPKTLGLVLSSTAVGMILGSYLFGVIGDWIGRRAGFQLSILLFAVFSGVAALTHNPVELGVVRLVTGIGIGGFAAIDTTMVSEFMPAARRGRMITLFTLSYPIGGLLASWIGGRIVPDVGWRAFFLIGVIPAIMALVARLTVPESPRFLLNRGRIVEARRSVEWLSVDQALPDTTVTAVASPDLGVPQDRLTLGALFSPTYRQRTLMLWGLWFAWSFSYFGTLLWLPSLLVQFRGVPGSDVFGFMMGFLAAAVTGRVMVALLIDVVGRKNMIAICGVCAAAAVLVFGQQTTISDLMIYGYIFAFFHDGGLCALSPYAPELYPTRARSTGVGLANGAGRVASMISPIVIGYVVTIGVGWVFVLLAIGYFIAAVTVLVFGQETKGLILETAALEAGPALGSDAVSNEINGLAAASEVQAKVR
jgi:MFS transporter, putative metabolite:H+ symporter